MDVFWSQQFEFVNFSGRSLASSVCASALWELHLDVGSRRHTTNKATITQAALRLSPGCSSKEGVVFLMLGVSDAVRGGSH